MLEKKAETAEVEHPAMVWLVNVSNRAESVIGSDLVLPGGKVCADITPGTMAYALMIQGKLVKDTGEVTEQEAAASNRDFKVSGPPSMSAGTFSDAPTAPAVACPKCGRPLKVFFGEGEPKAPTCPWCRIDLYKSHSFAESVRILTEIQ